jgi:DNA polymerase (family 10)
MIEINASPYRLDLDTPHCRLAVDRGVMLSINPDAHSTTGLDDVEYGIGVARRAGLTEKSVLNTFSAEAILGELKRKPC